MNRFFGCQRVTKPRLYPFFHMPQTYIIAQSAISYRRYITRSDRNGYHCKNPLLSDRQKRVFTWWSRGESNPCINEEKSLRYNGSLIGVGIFVVILEECSKLCCLILNVFFGYFGVDFAHGAEVRPASGYHRNCLRNAQVVAQGRKGTAQAVDADLWEVCFFAYAVDV